MIKAGFRASSPESGFTLMEIIIVGAMGAIVFLAFVLFFSRHLPFYHRVQVRQQLMSSSRIAMETILDRLRNGKARTIIISTPTTTPIVPNSRVDFVLQTPLPSGATAYAIYLDNTTNIAYTEEFIPGSPPKPRALASNVTSLMFTGVSSDPGIVSVTLRLDAAWDVLNDPTHVSTLILPNQTVHMVESP